MYFKEKNPNGDKIRIKLFKSNNSDILEKEINTWIELNHYKILTIQFLTEEYLYILYEKDH